jgi:NADH-quinone oxidoreductase subunit F
MPANAWEIDMALEEGIRLMTSRGPKRILEENGKVQAVELVQCASVFDHEGNFCPAFDDVTERVDADQVILAVGQTADLSFAEDNGLRVENGIIAVHDETLETGIPGVYAGGDVSRGPGAIIDAIAAGRRAASAIDRYLGGEGLLDETLAQGAETGSYTGRRERGFADRLRAETPSLPVDRRHEGFDEVEQSFDDDKAVLEAGRCLQCDLEVCLIQEGRFGRRA